MRILQNVQITQSATFLPGCHLQRIDERECMTQRIFFFIYCNCMISAERVDNI